MVIFRFILLFSSFISVFYSFGQVELNWSFKHPISNKIIPFGKKGSVQETLINTGELPDPFVGLNEEKFEWIEDFDWQFESVFNLSNADLSHEFIDIELPHVDTYSNIFINDSFIGNTQNSFVIYRFEVKKYLKEGINRIQVVFQSPVNYQKTGNRMQKEVGVTLPAPNDVGKTKVAPYCRKPQYQFGWDWALRMNTIGFWEAVKIIPYSINRVIGKNIQTSVLSEKLAAIDLQLILNKSTTDSLVWESDLFGKQLLTTNNGLIKRTEQIENPELWWPRGHGKQHLYIDTWKVTNQKGQILYQDTIRFGIKISELIQEKDQWGTSYTIRLNGKDIFCKGGNYIPQSVFPASVTNQQLREKVQEMAESNFNMVRVWGGGYYQPEAFYDACDELGIMVWQDFMFACAMYPGNQSFLDNVSVEFNQEIPRLTSHPSLVLLNGNNEVDVAWKNWGFQIQYGLFGKEADLILTYYDKLFKELLPKTVSSWTSIPYIHTSPLSNWGKDEYFNSGSMHYWGVWHGKDPIEDFGRKTGRFNAEYGFQSFPEYSTLLSFSDTTDWYLTSKVMKHHQKSYVGNGMIEKQSDYLYGKTTDFKRFVYLSQLTQAKAISIAISGHRSNMPRCSGTIYWQFNDCWPAPTWSSIDYYNNWKALQYSVKADFEDVTVLANIDTIGKEKYVFVSDVYEQFSTHVECEVLDLEGKRVTQFEQKVNSKEPVVISLFDNELRQYEKLNFVLIFSWKDVKNSVQKRQFTHIYKSLNTPPKSSVQFAIQSIDSVTKTIELTIEVSEFVQQLWISSQKKGVHFDRNFLDLLPGIHRIKIRYEGEIPQLSDFELNWL